MLRNAACPAQIAGRLSPCQNAQYLPHMVVGQGEMALVLQECGGAVGQGLSEVAARRQGDVLVEAALPEVDTSADTGFDTDGRFYHSCAEYPLKKRSFVLLRQQKRQIATTDKVDSAEPWFVPPTVD